MKKVIDGALYNTKTAKKVCEKVSNEPNRDKGIYVNSLKQLYKTKSGKYFFFVKNVFPAYVDANEDDLNPKFEFTEVEEKKIVPVSYNLAVQFASELVANEPNLKKDLGKTFPELSSYQRDISQKIQKKIHLTEKADWYLEMMVRECGETNSNFIENLIIKEYSKLYSKGIMQRDPYFEMKDD